MRATIVKDLVFDSVGYAPHAGQWPIHRSRARHRVVAGGRRFGKSQIGGHELTVEALATYHVRQRLADAGHRREFWIVGPEYTDSEKEFRSFWNDCERLKLPRDKPGSYNNPESGEMVVSLWSGRFIVHAKSAKYPGTLVGEGLSGVIMAEAAKIKPIVWTKYVRPTLADFLGWSLHSSTPEGRNQFYEHWTLGQSDAAPEWQSWRCPSWGNPYVYPLGVGDPEIEAQRLEMSGPAFSQEIGADFNTFVGRVLSDFDEETHVADFAFNPAWQTYAASDYGYTNPFVWLLIQVDPLGRVYIVDEIYETGLDDEQMVDEIRRRGLCPSSVLGLYPDPEDPKASQAISKAFKVPIRGGTGGLRTTRIEIMRRLMKSQPAHLPDGHADKAPMLMVNRRCTNTIREFSAWRYPRTAEEAAAIGRAAPEEPMKRDDHAPEAFSRFAGGFYGHAVRGRARVGASSMSG